MKVSKAALVALLLVKGVAYADGGKIKWGKDHDKALAEAKALGRPVALYFTTDW